MCATLFRCAVYQQVVVQRINFSSLCILTPINVPFVHICSVHAEHERLLVESSQAKTESIYDGLYSERNGAKRIHSNRQ